jgi:peptide/nickel transport system permease protein
MTRYAVRRVLGSVPMLLAIVIVVFVLLRLIPGDPVSAMLPDTATDKQIADLTHRFGFDDSIWVQLGKYLENVLHLDFGTSIRFGLPVRELIGQRLPATIELGVAAAVISIVVGIPLGVLAARRHGTWVDRVASVIGLIGISAPSFWVGMILILYVGGKTGWFPTGGRLPSGVEGAGPTHFLIIDSLLHGDIATLGTVLRHLALPAVTLGLSMAGILVRMTRSSLMEVQGDDYVRTARAKGAGEMRVVARHSMRNALLPIVTILGLEFATLLSGSVITETVFAWPGMGNMLITAVNARDYPLVQGCVILYAAIFIACNLIVDLTYALIDPRVRF